jgi:hypothetical protein
MASSRVQAHRGPLPNEPTSQGWISATSITVGQLWARNGAHQFGKHMPSIPARRALGFGWLTVVTFVWENSPAEVWGDCAPALLWVTGLSGCCSQGFSHPCPLAYVPFRESAAPIQPSHKFFPVFPGAELAVSWRAVTSNLRSMYCVWGCIQVPPLVQ